MNKDFAIFSGRLYQKSAIGMVQYGLLSSFSNQTALGIWAGGKLTTIKDED
jgi:hypothetical protein